MADILEKKKDGKVVSFKFTACLGRDANGKRICKCTTWKPTAGMSNAKARKQAEAEAYRWEQQLRSPETSPPQGEFLNSLPDKSEPISEEKPIPTIPMLRLLTKGVFSVEKWKIIE